MRTGVMKKAVKLVALTAVLLFALMTTSAFAAHEISGTALLFTYYDVRSVANNGFGAADNYFVVTNPDPCYWVQAHIRVRTGDKSVELLDFDVMLSPNDVFTFDLSDNGAGGVTFSSLDKYTISKSKMIAPFLKDLDGDGVTDGIVFSTDPASADFFDNLTSLIQLCQNVSQSVAAGFTQKGYVEVIMEGKIAHCGQANSTCLARYAADGVVIVSPGSADKFTCPGADNSCATTADNVSIIANTLYDLTSNVADATVGACNAQVVSASLGLEGREYLATIDAGANVVRLSHLNAETIDDFLPALPVTIDASGRGLILHKNTYDLERFSPRCLAVGDSDGDGVGDNTIENCFAYTAATTALANLESALNQGGADDMNFCFYVDSISNVGVHNKFGAAATFGPTLADLGPAVRLGLLPQTAANLATVAFNSSREFPATDGLGTSLVAAFVPKNFIHSHYIFSPAPAVFDVKSAFAFIFPTMHFIGEAPKVGSFTFYDLDESTVSTPQSGFISPGLPGPSAPANEEASLQTLSTSTPFGEGWVRIGPFTATNATRAAACDPGAACPGVTVNTLVLGGPNSYLPGYTGAYFVIGSQALSASLLQYLDY